MLVVKATHKTIVIIECEKNSNIKWDHNVNLKRVSDWYVVFDKALPKTLRMELNEAWYIWKLIVTSVWCWMPENLIGTGHLQAICGQSYLGYIFETRVILVAKCEGSQCTTAQITLMITLYLILNYQCCCGLSYTYHHKTFICIVNVKSKQNHVTVSWA